MNYLEFLEALHSYQVFSTRDIIKIFPAFDSRRLVEWQQKGYLQKIVNKCYVFSDIPKNEWLKHRISNCIYKPSYISLESALAHYNLIPEAVFAIQNITMQKTMNYQTEVGVYNYRTVKPKLFFGYTVNRIQQLPILMAEPEKAILDYLYLNATIKSLTDIESIRLNQSVVNEIIDWKKFASYTACFESTTINRKAKLLLKIYSNARTI